MYKIMMKYYTTTKRYMTIYRGEIELLFKGESYTFEIETLSNPTPPKSSSYILSVKDCDQSIISDAKELKILLKDGNRCLYKLFLSIDIELENQLEKKRESTQVSQINEFTVRDNINFINGDLSEAEISLITKSKENNTKLFSSSLLFFLDEFIHKWNHEIVNEGNESNFQDLLKEYQMLIPILFGFQGKAYFEDEHIEGDLNRYDIEGEDWIIELKTSKTSLFSKASSRNNIQGISPDFIGADNQLDLYIKKKNREKTLASSFVRGLLIIGNSGTIDNKDKKLAFLNMCEKSQSNILTFTEVLEKAKMIKENIIK